MGVVQEFMIASSLSGWYTISKQEFLIYLGAHLLCKTKYAKIAQQSATCESL